jgi:hypothetical protein
MWMDLSSPKQGDILDSLIAVLIFQYLQEWAKLLSAES